MALGVTFCGLRVIGSKPFGKGTSLEENKPPSPGAAP